MSPTPQERALQVLLDIESAPLDTPELLEQFRLRYLGTKNQLKDLFALLGQLPGPEKGAFGKLMNQLKDTAEQRYAEARQRVEEKVSRRRGFDYDLTAPAEPLTLGARHPVSVVMHQIVGIFSRLGFSVAQGPEIEDEWHNFTALNTPDDHPARDMQDTFYLRNSPNHVLRTHTTPVQVRVLERQKPPIRMIFPGRVYRNETISARSHCQFHQIDGVYVAERVSFADLKQTMLHFAHQMFGPQTRIRLRPSYFPFTEPSAEMDVTCFLCKGDGCSVCKHTGWVEILGCGMIDPQVLINVGLDPEVYSGFAFGMGIERQAMMRYGIKDIRLLFENDVRLLRQFQSAL